MGTYFGTDSQANCVLQGCEERTLTLDKVQKQEESGRLTGLASYSLSARNTE